MIRFTSLLRNLNSKGLLPLEQYRSFSKSSKPSSSSSSSSDDERSKLKQHAKSSSSSDEEGKRKLKVPANSKGEETSIKANVKPNEVARNKLNQLLSQMLKDDINTTNQPKLDLAKPKNKRKSLNAEPGTESVKSEPVEKKIVKAVEDVANVIGGDVKKTESELLQKLLTHDNDQSSKSTTASLSDIFKDMKIDRESKAPEQISRSQQVQQLLRMSRGKKQGTFQKTQRDHKQYQGFKQRQESFSEPMERVTLFGNEPLDIFPPLKEVESWPEVAYNKTWKALYERELHLAVTHPPTNYFQQMILWTQQGKLWKFPIDNEQGLEEEKKVYFAEHIFLERQLDSWCPLKGPIRHFMELVCVGLSKNHYLSVEKKHEHIEWFRNYFAQKKDLLQEVGAVPKSFDFSKNQKICDST